MNLEIENVFQEVERRMSERINSTFGNLVRDVNTCMENVLQSTITNAESLETYMKQDLRNIKLTLNADQKPTKGNSHKDNKTKNDINGRLKVYDKTIDNIKEERNMQGNIDNVLCEPFNGETFDDNFIDANQMDSELIRTDKKNEVKHAQGLFECNQCSYKTKQKSHVTQHIKMVHAKIKNYNCDYCGQSFGQRCNLE